MRMKTLGELYRVCTLVMIEVRMRDRTGGGTADVAHAAHNLLAYLARREGIAGLATEAAQQLPLDTPLPPPDTPEMVSFVDKVKRSAPIVVDVG